MTGDRDATRRRMLAALGGTTVPLLAGCLSSGGDGDDDGSDGSSGDSTTGSTDVSDGSTDSTGTAEATTGDESTDGTGEDGTGGTNPGPDVSFDEIYQENMVHAHDDARIYVDNAWDRISDELEREGHDLDNADQLEGAELSNLLEEVAGRAGEVRPEGEGAAAFAYAVHEKIGLDTDQVIIDARTANVGQQMPTASVLLKDGDGYVKDMYRPAGQRQNPDQFEDSAWYARHDEEEYGGAEETLQNIWDDENLSSGTMLDASAIRGLVEADDGEVDWDLVDRRNDDILVGYEHSDEGEIAYTEDAAMRMDEILDPSNMRENPQEYGSEAYNLIVGANEFFHNEVREDKFMEVDYDGQEFQYSEVDEDQHEELKVNYGG